ncbi:MAG: hypothetical protein DRP78_01480, partial [Candidatus Omnitrophota bacterium]
LNAFKMVARDSFGRPVEQEEWFKQRLVKLWESSTAVERIIGVFSLLRDLGIYSDDLAGMEIGLQEAVLGSAAQFISRAYLDDAMFEFSPGPYYDSEYGISIGIEIERGLNNDFLQVNLGGVHWAAKAIKAAHLAAYPYYFPQSDIFGYFRSQLTDTSSVELGIQSRISYLVLPVRGVQDLTFILDKFVLLSIALENYMQQQDMDLARIWAHFNSKVEEIIQKEQDIQLSKEYFQQASFVRFLELISINNGNNGFCRQLRALVKDILSEIKSVLDKKAENNNFSIEKIKFKQNLPNIEQSV